MERCDRCGEVDEDRRTLWMACFYAMNELPVPFKQVAIRGVVEKQKDEWTHNFYTLRVCKSCRAEWMAAIEKWFTEGKKKQQPTGTGVFVRKNGVNVELTEEEIKERWPS